MLAQLDVGRLPFPADTFDMIFTDPPYAKRYLDTYRALAHEAARVLKPHGFLSAMCGGLYLNQIFRFFTDAGLSFYWLYQLSLKGKNALAWRHGKPTNKPISSRVKHVLVYSKGPAVARTATIGLYQSNGPDKRWHPWGQDVDSHRYYIECFTYPGALILDPMAGGGTTGQACRLIGRRAIQGDIDPTACLTIATRKDQD